MAINKEREKPMSKKRRPSTPKGLVIRSATRAWFGNFPVGIERFKSGTFVSIRIGTTGFTTTLTATNARRLADRLHDAADALEAETNNPERTTAA